MAEQSETREGDNCVEKRDESSLRSKPIAKLVQSRRILAFVELNDRLSFIAVQKVWLGDKDRSPVLRPEKHR